MTDVSDYCEGCDGIESKDVWCDDCVDGSLWVKTGTFGCDPDKYAGPKLHVNIHIGKKEVDHE